MQGKQDYQPELFTVFNMEELIPKGRLLNREHYCVIIIGSAEIVTEPPTIVRVCP
jgi:hypothetical protein